SDLIRVTGAAAIGDDTSLQLFAEPGVYDPSVSYTVLEASAGVTGNFTSVSWDVPLFFYDPEARNEGAAITVYAVRNGVKFSDAAETKNQKAVAEALDDAAADGEGDQVIALLLGAADAADVRQALDALAGQIYTQRRLLSATAMRSFMDAAFLQIDTVDPSQRVWAAAHGGVAALSSQNGFFGASFSHKGLVAGWSPLTLGAWNFGVVAGVGDASIRMPGDNSLARTHGHRFGAYARMKGDS